MPITMTIQLMCQLLLGRLQKARGERGASAVEWVIIAAIVVGIALTVGTILMGALEGEANEIADEVRSK